MVVKQIRKTPQRIKEEILKYLDLQPLSVEQLRKKIKDSNWSTINKYLEELKKENLVREIISTGKIKVYQKIMGDTYFDLPITEEQRKEFHTLFSMIFEEYKKKGITPTKTHVAKCAVYAIDNETSGLNNLPIVWYLYGMMPLIAVDTSTKYQKEKDFSQESKIRSLILQFIDENGNKKSSQIQKEQHRRYNEEMYVTMDRLLEVLNKPYFENKEVNKLLDELFVSCPTENDFVEIFDLTESVISIIQKMDFLNLKLQDYRKQILLILDSLWKLIAIYKLSQNILQINAKMSEELLYEIYLRGAIEDRKRSLQEYFLELNSIYLNKLSNFDFQKIDLSDESKEISRIMEDFI